MGAADQVKVMSCEEVGDNFLSKAITDSSLVCLPVLFHIGRISPKKVIQQPVVRNVGGPCDVANVVHLAQSRRQTSMDAEDLSGHNGSNRKRIEAIDKCLPDFDVAPSLAFVIESVDSSDVGTLMVSSEQEEVFGEFELIAQQ